MSSDTISKNPKYRHKANCLARKTAQKIQILKCLEAKKSRRQSKEASAVRPGTSAQISSKPKHLRAERILGNKKSPFGLSQRSAFLRRAFQSLLMRRFHVGYEWNFNYLDAFTFLSLTGDCPPPSTLLHQEPQEGRLIGVHVWLPSKSGVFLWGWKSKPLFQKIFFAEKHRAKDTLRESEIIKTIFDLSSKVVSDLKSLTNGTIHLQE